MEGKPDKLFEFSCESERGFFPDRSEVFSSAQPMSSSSVLFSLSSFEGHFSVNAIRKLQFFSRKIPSFSEVILNFSGSN